MKIIRTNLLAGAQNVSGITVVIDVFRTFTTSAMLFEYGIKELVLVDDIESARRRSIVDTGRRPATAPAPPHAVAVQPAQPGVLSPRYAGPPVRWSPAPRLANAMRMPRPRRES